MSYSLASLRRQERFQEKNNDENVTLPIKQIITWLKQKQILFFIYILLRKQLRLVNIFLSFIVHYGYEEYCADDSNSPADWYHTSEML